MVSNRKHVISLLASVEVEDSDEFETISAVISSEKPVSWELIKQYTASDECLQTVIKYLKNSSDPEVDVPEEVRKFLKVLPFRC